MVLFIWRAWYSYSVQWLTWVVKEWDCLWQTFWLRLVALLSLRLQSNEVSRLSASAASVNSSLQVMWMSIGKSRTAWISYGAPYMVVLWLLPCSNNLVRGNHMQRGRKLPWKSTSSADKYDTFWNSGEPIVHRLCLREDVAGHKVTIFLTHHHAFMSEMGCHC